MFWTTYFTLGRGNNSSVDFDLFWTKLRYYIRLNQKCGALVIGKLKDFRLVDKSNLVIHTSLESDSCNESS